MKKRSARKEGSDDVASLGIPAGLFIGMGIGFVTGGEMVPWMFIGLGIGFILFLLLRLGKKSR